MKKANAPPTVKEKARLVFIREKASQAKEKSRRKYSVPGPFTVIDGARVIEHHDPEPEENSSAADSVEHMKSVPLKVCRIMPLSVDSS